MNWGKGLVLSMSLFIVFIIGLVIYMVNNNDSLYTEDYYEKGESHSATMRAIQNGANIHVQYAKELLSIDLGKEGLVQTVELKHMSNQKFDQTITNSKSDTRRIFQLQVPQLETGIWYIEIAGVYDAQPFLKKHKLIIE